MIGSLLARAGLAGAVPSLLALLALPPGAAAEPLDAVGLFEAAATTAVAPEGSTLVPSSRQLRGQLGQEGSTPSSSAGGCSPTWTSQPSGVAPASPNGAVSTSHGVLVSNNGFIVFDRANLAACPALPVLSLKHTDLFGLLSVSPTEIIEDPRVVFDSHVGRFVLVAISRDTANTDQFLYLAVSDDATAAAWSAYQIATTGWRADPATDTVENPVLGYNGLGWAISATLRRPGGLVNSVAGFTDKPAPGGGLTSIVVSPPVFAGVPGAVPPIIEGAGNDLFFLAADSANDVVVRYKFSLSVLPFFVMAPTGAETITVPAFAPPSDAEQLNGEHLDTGDGSFLAPSIQIGTSLWNVHAVDVGGYSRFRVYKFSTSGTAPLFTYTPTVSAREHLFNPSMATSSETAGTRAFVSASLTAPDIGVGGMLMTVFNGPNDSPVGWSWDFPATTSAEYDTRADGSTSCTASAENVCLWGPYSATQVDPADGTGNTGWTFNQFPIGGDEDGWEVFGLAVTGVGVAPPPLAPIATAATGVTQTRFTANWTANPAALGYRLDVSTDPGFATYVAPFQQRDVGNTTSFPVTGLTPGATYYYRVWSFSGGPLGAPSNTIAVTTVAVPVVPPDPDAPTCTLTAEPETIDRGASATLAWTSANSTSGAIDDLGALSPVDAGTIEVTPTTTTTYTAVFTGPGGTADCVVAVTVRTTGAWDPLALLGLLALAGASRLRRRGG